MPTVLRRAGFRVVVFPPPREHGPPHVHVQDSEGEVVIELATTRRRQRIRRVSGMHDNNVVKVWRLVEAHADYLLTCWRKYHG
jgi:hypothetical protein